MRHANLLRLVVKLGVGTALAVMIACGSDGAFSLGTKDNEKAAPGDTDGTSSSSSSGGGGLSPSANGPAASGVVIVHAANFPSFRLCFEKSLDRLPQPDRTVMPEANVVGVEIGSLVRIDPIEAPGIVYVIKQKSVQTLPGSPDDKTCRELIGDGETDGKLDRNVDYFETKPIPSGIGQGRVETLAITGCGNQALLDILDDVDTAQGNHDGCGTDWKSDLGNLQAKVVELPFSSTGRVAATVPIQVVNLAPSVTVLKGSVDIRFGVLSADAASGLAIDVAPPFTAGKQVTLDIDQDAESTFGTNGFIVNASTTGGVVRSAQSLADIQQLSSPNDLPTSYYQAASNYALLLVGDPSHKNTVPGFNPRRTLHLLAVPVLDPSKVDAGTSEDTDAGPR